MAMYCFSASRPTQNLLSKAGKHQQYDDITNNNGEKVFTIITNRFLRLFCLLLHFQPIQMSLFRSG